MALNAVPISRLLVVLRGEIFRTGGQHSRIATPSMEPQWRALRTVREHVLRPARTAGWSLRVLEALANEVPDKGLANAPSVNDHLHSLCKRLRNVRYWLPQRYDANSGRDNNPLYRMVGRREQTRGRMERYIKSRGDWMYAAAGCWCFTARAAPASGSTSAAAGVASLTVLRL